MIVGHLREKDKLTRKLNEVHLREFFQFLRYFFVILFVLPIR